MSNPRSDAQDLDDLAWTAAMEHMVSTLWLVVSSHSAQMTGRPLQDLAQEYRDGLIGTMTEGSIPAPVLALMRGHAARVLDHMLASAETAAELNKG